jgi:hypothetical protein
MRLQRLREANDSDRLGEKPIDSDAFFASLRQTRFATIAKPHPVGA